MNARQRIASLSSSLLLILLGGTGIMTSLGFFSDGERPILKAFKSWFVQGSAYDGMFLFAGYGVILLVGLWLASQTFQRDYSPESVRMETKNGHVEISLEALEEVIKSLKDQIDGIRNVSPEIEPTHGNVKIRVNLDVSKQVDVPKVTEEFEKILRTELSDVFKVKNLDTISVRIKNVSNFEAQSSQPDGASNQEFDGSGDESEH